MNFWTILTMIFGVAVITLTILKIKKMEKTNPKTVNTFEIWLLGLFALISSFAGQIIDLGKRLDSIESSGEITPTAVSDALKETLIWNFGIGLVVFATSIILWISIYRIKKSKIKH